MWHSCYPHHSGYYKNFRSSGSGASGRDQHVFLPMTQVRLASAQWWNPFICSVTCLKVTVELYVYFSWFCLTGANCDKNWSFPNGLAGKESTCNAGDIGAACSIPGSGRSLGEGHGNLLQYSCLGNPMDKGAWWAPVLMIAKSQHDWVTKNELKMAVFLRHSHSLGG